MAETEVLIFEALCKRQANLSSLQYVIITCEMWHNNNRTDTLKTK